MSANLEAKAAVVAEIKEKIQSAQSMVFLDYRGLTVEEVTELRSQFRAAGVEYKVLKNTLIQRAANEAELAGLEPFLSGPTAVAFGIQDPVAPAKILTEYIKKTKKATIKGGVLEGQVIDAKGVEALANMPSREQLLAKMLGSMNAPITGLVTVLGGTISAFVRALDAIRQQKEAA